MQRVTCGEENENTENHRDSDVLRDSVPLAAGCCHAIASGTTAEDLRWCCIRKTLLPLTHSKLVPSIRPWPSRLALKCLNALLDVQSRFGDNLLQF